jgi:hypothetical protein
MNIGPKQPFNRLCDLSHAGSNDPASFEGAAARGVFDGTWTNADWQTDSIARLVIRRDDRSLIVRPYGACQSTPCDWGSLAALPYAIHVGSLAIVAFTAVHTTAFSQTILVGRIGAGLDSLTVDSFTHFTDDSGRADYTGHDLLFRGPAHSVVG